ncbi:heparinase II/III family protein [Muricauda sp. SCSIO 64092]|uniref:alginate lyase family protein n=1 Tax=Allomuricauda sp. SCSIO 64092 TaxID=2908842 RepID=UPI001FF2C051|nr:alginate lyase family protein [Muricauda sp. SCSIO 64092]UOY08826.1 heparinase II/III family protein [Muricauda sp. SCSIO 64092]
MDRGRLILLFYTLKFLRPKQVYYRLHYFVKNKFFKRNYDIALLTKSPTLLWEGGIPDPMSYIDENSFRFLNLKKDFKGSIDWNFNGYGKLWTYNLNYFDFLNQENVEKAKALRLIWDYIANEKEIKDGLEPYPISLRGINWIKFISKNDISEKKINQNLYNQYQILLHNLEYHLLGNHLLENGYSLFFGAYYFKDDKIYEKAKSILILELKEQVLGDGAHFELSPMYHQILLHRLLDCINLAQLNMWQTDDLLPFLKGKASKMLSWLQTVTFYNGNIPMVNDSAYGIAPSSNKLFDYAKNLGLKWPKSELSDSGYRKFNKFNYELFVDVGNVGPDYQPGHAHSDTFSFELQINEKPFIVDTGTSTYKKNDLRQSERETSAHNTVKIGAHEQTQVWGGFRVAKRAKIVNLRESANMVSASHDGYSSMGLIHKRSFSATERIIINDRILSNKSKKIESQAFFHIHPSIKDIVLNNRHVSFGKMNVSLDFEGEINDIKIEDYKYCVGFNKTEVSKKICVSFSKELTTTILL